MLQKPPLSSGGVVTNNKTCKTWKNWRTTSYPTGGLCNKARDESAPAYVYAYDHNPANPPVLVTQADFGCTMHEAQTV